MAPFGPNCNYYFQGTIFDPSTGDLASLDALIASVESCDACKNALKQAVQKKLITRAGPHKVGSLLQHFLQFTAASSFQPSVWFDENR